MTFLETDIAHINTINDGSPGIRVLRVVLDADITPVQIYDDNPPQVLLADLSYTPGWLRGHAYIPAAEGKWTRLPSPAPDVTINETHIVSYEVLRAPHNGV